MSNSEEKTSKTPPPARPGPRGLRKWLFRLAAMILAPALVLLLTEGTLRLFGYGYPTGFFRKIPGQEAYTGNPRFGWRFFPRALSRAPVPFRLPAEKPEGTYRIFVLGGSAALGTPDPAFGFARIVEVMLREQFPAARFEVINAAMTAINSHVVLPIARDCADHDPDLFIVYMGNNEVVGPFGAGTVFGGYSPSLSTIRASLWVRTTTIGQLIQNLAGATGATDQGEWRGMEMFLEQRVAADDPRLDKIVDHFRANLTDICAAARGAGAGTIVCTVATNLKDCAPFASMHRAGLDETQKAKWEEMYESAILHEQRGGLEEAKRRHLAAVEIDDHFADLHFRLGRLHWMTSYFDRARESFVRARDLDALRFRADSRLNAAVRDVAGARAEEGVVLVDAEKRLAGSALTPNGILGEELLHEHVHLNFDGNYELARAVFEAVVGQLPEAIRSGAAPRPPAKDRCAELLALTHLDRHRMRTGIWRTTGQPPFTNQYDHARRRERRFRKLQQGQRRAMPPEDSRAVALRSAALQRNPDDLHARRGLAALLEEKGRYAESAEQWRALLQHLPEDGDARVGLGAALLGLGRTDEAMAEFLEAIETSHDPVPLRYQVGTVLYAHGKVDDAIAQFRKVLRARPGHTKSRISLGAALFAKGQRDEAIAELQETVRLRGEDAETRGNLGVALFGAGRVDEAIPYLQDGVRLDPYNQIAWEKLAEAKAGKGKLTEAARCLDAAERVAPDLPQVRAEFVEMRRRLGLPASPSRPQTQPE